jgi:hypothetical protein
MWDASAGALLRNQLEHAFEAARWQVEGLTDDEYFWEPADRCWSVRRRADARSTTPCGRGDWVIDDEWPPRGAPPVTTIGWRVVHLIAWTDVYCNWTFGDATRSYVAIDVPGDARTAVEELARAQREFAAAVSTVGDDDFAEERTAHWGQRFPIGVLVWQIMVEHLHHAAEIGVLRDLHRGHGRTDPWPEPTSS